MARLSTASGIVPSAFVKAPVEGPIHLGRLGLAGDEQADERNHGGPEKAVCAYPGEHYPYWEERLGRRLEPAAFGENFTTSGLLEDELEIGAIFAINEAVVQVSQPRAPCFKLAGRHGLRRLPLWVRQTGRTGFYLRVLEEGALAPGDELRPLERPSSGLTVGEVNRLSYQDRHDIEGLERAIAVPALSDAYRASLRRAHGRALRRAGRAAHR